MVTVENIKDIFFYLINDENFCRLVVYGENPFDKNKYDIKDDGNVIDLMRNQIKFSPQISDLQEKNETRLLIYKSFTKLGNANSVIRDNSVQIDIFVPHYLTELDFRIYLIEDKISSILDGKTIKGLGNLSYTNGNFTASPINGFSFFSMTFSTEEGRSVYGKR